MRKELILVLLGIICTSFMSTLLSGYVQIETDKILLDTVVGVVGAGNFSYWQLGHTGPLLVELTSLSGDADLYVSENIRPSYEIDKNNFSSVTCGPDTVSIPAEFPRPLGIGVFGHWSHALSEYSIQVFLDAAAASADLLTTLERASSIAGPDGEPKRPREKAGSRKTEEERPSVTESMYVQQLDGINNDFDVKVLVSM